MAEWTPATAQRAPEPQRASTTPTAAARYSAVGLGGVVGAWLRWSHGALLASAVPTEFPWGTLTINVVGSLALCAFLAVLLRSAGVHPLWRPFFAVGVCGAYTTFSSFENETYAFVTAAHQGLAAAYVGASLAVGLAFAFIGLSLGETSAGRRVVGPAIASPALALAVIAGLAVATHADASAFGRIGFAAVALGGSTGAIARYALGGWINERAGPFFPWGTLAVNIAGCTLIGLFEGRAEASGGAAPELRLLLVTGWLGGFTTFSTFAFESLTLAREGSRRRAAANVAGSVVGGFLGVALGRHIGGHA